MSFPSPIDWLTGAEIEAALRSMLGDVVQIADEWTVERMVAGGGDALGIWRISGTLKTSGQDVPWSMVLKGWEVTDASRPSSAYNWKLREAALYRSGVLDRLDGVSAPAIYGLLERNGTTWIWLEDLSGMGQPDWTITQYATAARSLGRFNGSYLSRRQLPDHPGLSQRWLAGMTLAASPTISALDEYLQHPIVEKVLPPQVTDRLLRIWDKKEVILAELDALPQTFCHLDAFHGNTFFRSREGYDEIVLIDWSYAGRAAVGEELAALCVAGAMISPKMPDDFDEIERVAFASYVEGLRDMGWRGEEERVWEAYRSAALLRYGPAILLPTLPVLMSEEGRAELSASFRIPINRLQDHLAEFFRWIANHANDT